MILLRDLHEIGHVFLRVEEFLLLLKRSSGHGGKKIVGGNWRRNSPSVKGVMANGVWVSEAAFRQ